MVGFWDAAHRHRNTRTGPFWNLKRQRMPVCSRGLFGRSGTRRCQNDATTKCEAQCALQLLDRAPRVLHEGTRIVKSRSSQRFRLRKRQGSDRALPKHVASQVRHRRKGRLRTVRGHAKRDEQDDEGRNDRRRRGAKRHHHLRKVACCATRVCCDSRFTVRARAARAE